MKNFVAEVEIEQKYQNKEETALEVIYNFPVEEEAAVIGCSALLDGETIVATIQENEKAEKMYKKAIESNKTAVKLSSTRPDIFQMKVGNLSPGARIRVYNHCQIHHGAASGGQEDEADDSNNNCPQVRH